MGKAEAGAAGVRIKSTCSRVTGLIDLGNGGDPGRSSVGCQTKNCWPGSLDNWRKDDAAWAIPSERGYRWLE